MIFYKIMNTEGILSSQIDLGDESSFDNEGENNFGHPGLDLFPTLSMTLDYIN